MQYLEVKARDPYKERAPVLQICYFIVLRFKSRLTWLTTIRLEVVIQPTESIAQAQVLVTIQV